MEVKEYWYDKIGHRGWNLVYSARHYHYFQVVELIYATPIVRSQIHKI